MTRFILPGLLISLLLLACTRKELDYDLVDDIRLEPNWELPLIHAHLDLNDLAERDSMLVENPDKSLSIFYRDDSLLALRSIDFVDIPNQDAVDFDFSTAINPVDFQLDLGTVQGVELYQVSFRRGKLVAKLRSPGYSDTARVELEVANATIGGGQPLLVELSLPAGDTLVTTEIDLQGTQFDLTNATPGEFNYIAMRLEILNELDFAPTDLFEIELQFVDLSLENATGYFGQRNIALPAGNFEFDISGLEDFASGFRLNDPKVRLRASSSIGLPIDLATNLKGVNARNEVTDLQEPPGSVAASPHPDSVSISVLEFDDNNSNIVDFLAALPNRILYSGDVDINSAGRDTNFLDASSEFVVGVELDIPLEVSIENMSLSETFDFTMITENPDELQELTLFFRSRNGLPLELLVEVELLDSSGQQVLDSFDLNLLQAAPVDANGRVTRMMDAEESMEFSDALLENFRRSGKMRFTATVNSTPGAPFVKFYTDYALDLQVAAQAKLNLQP